MTEVTCRSQPAGCQREECWWEELFARRVFRNEFAGVEVAIDETFRGGTKVGRDGIDAPKGKTHAISKCEDFGADFSA